MVRYDKKYNALRKKSVQENISYSMEAFRCFECAVWDAQFIKKSHEKENLEKQTYKREKGGTRCRKKLLKKTHQTAGWLPQ